MNSQDFFKCEVKFHRIVYVFSLINEECSEKREKTILKEWGRKLRCGMFSLPNLFYV